MSALPATLKQLWQTRDGLTRRAALYHAPAPVRNLFAGLLDNATEIDRQVAAHIAVAKAQDVASAALVLQAHLAALKHLDIYFAEAIGAVFWLRLVDVSPPQSHSVADPGAEVWRLPYRSSIQPKPDHYSFGVLAEGMRRRAACNAAQIEHGTITAREYRYALVIEDVVTRITHHPDILAAEGAFRRNGAIKSVRQGMKRGRLQLSKPTMKDNTRMLPDIEIKIALHTLKECWKKWPGQPGLLKPLELDALSEVVYSKSAREQADSYRALLFDKLFDIMHNGLLVPGTAVHATQPWSRPRIIACLDIAFSGHLHISQSRAQGHNQAISTLALADLFAQAWLTDYEIAIQTPTGKASSWASPNHRLLFELMTHFDDFIQRFEQPHKANIVLSRPWDLKDLSERLPTKPERLDWQQARDIEPTQEISVNLDPRKPGQSTAQAAAQAASSSAFVNPSVPVIQSNLSKI